MCDRQRSLRYYGIAHGIHGVWYRRHRRHVAFSFISKVRRWVRYGAARMRRLRKKRRYYTLTVPQHVQNLVRFFMQFLNPVSTATPIFSWEQTSWNLCKIVLESRKRVQGQTLTQLRTSHLPVNPGGGRTKPPQTAMVTPRRKSSARTPPTRKSRTKRLLQRWKGRKRPRIASGSCW